MAEVESLMKNDTVRDAAKARCGIRLLKWYESLRSSWR